MTRSPLTPVSAREVVHLLILEEIARVLDREAVALKGGVNLRLFFGSVRYSEDMDLDGAPASSEAIRSTIKGIFRDRSFAKRLRELGIRGLDPGQGANKDSETTFRYKFGVLVNIADQIRYTTFMKQDYLRTFSSSLS